MDVSFETIVLGVVPVVLAITMHEAAHGFVARMFGDQTAWMLGRVTLNPFKHVDLVGTVLLPGVLLLMHAPFLFGWAKPVPVNFANLRNPKRDMLWVAAAGPGANFVMAFAWALLLKASLPQGVLASSGLVLMARIGIEINLMLMALNLLPIPPLDGGRIAVSLLPPRASMVWARLENYGLFIILGLLLVPGLLNALMSPLVNAGAHLLQALVGL